MTVHDQTDAEFPVESTPSGNGADGGHADGPDHNADDDSEPTTPRARRKVDRGLLLASFAIACGVVLIVWGLAVAVTGDDGIDRPEAIESLQPVENAVQVLQQERVVVDLEPGYEARLVIDGIELPVAVLGQSSIDGEQLPEPGQQVELPPTAIFDPGNSVISFQPVVGAPIESFEEGTHDASVVYWKSVDGPDRARTYNWSFEVV